MSEQPPWWPPPDGTVLFDDDGYRIGVYIDGKPVLDRLPVYTRAIALYYRVLWWLVDRTKAGFLTGLVAVCTFAAITFFGTAGWVVIFAIQAGLFWQEAWHRRWTRRLTLLLVAMLAFLALLLLGWA